ncbi:unnamed protein product [Caenorhabditis auriculariae]|uniref:CS domain-containing protein n=1 Tax=Caenorhabditis auriculariae TaxID=2777116 RepID=A0A8S1HAH1_9PELO|nr:unnamed protein product [Caenorhabditis auriculariae]
MASFPDSSKSDTSCIPGPLGCRYDDNLNHLEIQLVVPGIREKTFMKASNTQVYLKSDPYSLGCTVEIVKIDKKKKPPEKTVIDRRFYEVQRFPAEISDVTFKLKKDCCVLTIRKKTAQSWANQMSQYGMT